MLSSDSFIPTDACAIDAGDGVTTDAVLGFTQTRFAQRIVAIKGVAGQAADHLGVEDEGLEALLRWQQDTGACFTTCFA